MHTLIEQRREAQKCMRGAGVGACHAIERHVAAFAFGAIEHGVEGALGAAIRVGQVDLRTLRLDAADEECEGFGIRVRRIEDRAEGIAEGPGARGLA